MVEEKKTSSPRLASPLPASSLLKVSFSNFILIFLFFFLFHSIEIKSKEAKMRAAMSGGKVSLFFSFLLLYSLSILWSTALP
jgi:hypothetical protein